MIYGVLFILNILALCLLLSAWKPKHFLHLLSVGCGLAVSEYLSMAILLYYLGIFQVIAVLSLCGGIHLLLLILFRKQWRAGVKSLTFDLRGSLCILALLLCMVPFSVYKSLPIAPLFDAGVYGAKTIDLVNGGTEPVKSLKEFEIASNSVKIKRELIELQKTQTGVYLYPVSEEDTSLLYEYHGLSTWPLFMALSAQIFGLEGMSNLLTLLYILCGVYLFGGLLHLKVKTWAALLSTFLFLFSPLTVYLAKLPLSEMMITALFLFTFFLLTEKDLHYKALAAFPLCLISFAHLSMLMYIPVLYACLFFLCLLKNERIYGFINLCMCIFYPISLLYAQKTSYLYASGQLTRMFHYRFSFQQLLLIASVLVLLAIAIQAAALIQMQRSSPISKGLLHLYERWSVPGIKILSILLGLCTLYQFYNIGFTNNLEPTPGESWRFRELYVNQGPIEALLHLNLFNIMMATSYICIPYILFKAFKNKKWTEGQKLLFYVFLYSIAIYTIIRPDSPINYSSSRYFITTIIPAALILLGLFIQSKKMAAVIASVGIATALPFNAVLAVTHEYDGNLEFLTDIKNTVQKGSIICINPEETFPTYQLTTNLRETNGNLVYNSKSLENILPYFPNTPIFVVSQSELNDLRLEKVSEQYYPIISEFYNLDMIYPLHIGRGGHWVRIYRVYDKTLDMDPDDISFLFGFHSFENQSVDSFAWSGERSSFSLPLLSTQNPAVRITCNGLPEEIFDGGKKYSIAFQIQNETFYQITLTKENHLQYSSFEVPIPKELISPSSLTQITMVGDTWNTGDYFDIPKESARNLCLPITKIEIIS